MRFRKWLRRVLCWHKFREVEYRLFCSIVHCTKCGGVYYDDFGFRKRYLGQYEQFFDEKGEMKP